ncbi:hypothetical protein P3S67_003090 [Capsicum chacoense]
MVWVIQIIPYSVVKLLAHETFKVMKETSLEGTSTLVCWFGQNKVDITLPIFRNFFKDRELSVIGRLAAGACAGMTSSFVTYPLDVLTLRLAENPGYKTMNEIRIG